MRLKYLVLSPLLALLVVIPTVAADPVVPKAPSPFLPAIEIPSLPTPPIPPTPANARVQLTKDLTYSFITRVPVVVRTYGLGAVAIKTDVVAANETLRDATTKFTDGKSPHIYKGPVTVYNVTPVTDGKVDLVITPIGFKAEKEIITVGLDVFAGQGPQPPPNPDPTPKPPTPDPPKPVPVTSFRVIFVIPPTLTQAQFNAVYAKSVKDYLDAKTTKDGTQPGWRIWTKDQNAANEVAPVKALWEAAQPKITVVPCVLIEVNGSGTLENLPSSPEDSTALFDKYLKGGK